MTGARKGADLRRDPRFALHGPTFHPADGRESEWPGEAKIAGRAIPAGRVVGVEVSDEPDGEMFVADITEVVITGLNAEATKLVVESWTLERGLRTVERDWSATADSSRVDGMAGVLFELGAYGHAPFVSWPYRPT
jgi:hypothetical protein